MLERMVGLSSAIPNPRLQFVSLENLPEIDYLLFALQRRTCPIPCPEGLWRRSWEQPALLPWTRYAPLQTRPLQHDHPQHPLPWLGSCVSIFGLLEDAISKILFRWDAVEDWHWAFSMLPTVARTTLAWLMCDPVEHWYLSLSSAQQKSFCMLVQHFCIEVGWIGQEDYRTQLCSELLPL